MFKIREVVERIQAESRVLPSQRMARRLDPDVELGELSRRIEKLTAGGRLGEANVPPRLDVDALWSRWTHVRPDTSSFSRRELLALAWDSRTVSDRTFLGALESADLIPTRPRFLRGLWHVHQQRWRLETADLIEAHIFAAIGGQSILPRWLRLLSDNRGLLTRQAIGVLVRRIGLGWHGGLSVLEPFGVLPDGNLGRLVLEEATKAWLEQVKTARTRSAVEELVEAGVHGLLPKQSTPIERFRHCVEQLLLVVPGSSQQYKSALTRLILSDPRLGHPVRVSTRGNWVGLSAQAKRIAVQLFAARDLNAFFEVLIGQSDDYQRRRAFWEPYVESSQLVDFAIASDPYDRQRLSARLGTDRASVATLLGAPDAYSAFVMRFLGRRDIVIVEISQPNNAMYIFDTAVFESEVGSLDDSRFVFTNLKSRTHSLQWLAHSANTWHRRFADVLAGYGVHRGTHG